MRAVAYETNGGPEVLQFREMPDPPQPGPGEVLIEVAYAGLNYAEVMRRRGDFGPANGPTVPGLEVSGRVAALGAGVEDLTVGEPVAAFTNEGGYAELALAPAAMVQPLRTPAGEVDLKLAGGFSVIVPATYGLLADVARMREGDTVLVHAAAGGVGSVAAQIARALGADRVFGTVSSQEKREYALRHGYDDVWLREGWVDCVRAATGGRGVDIALDSIGGETRTAGLDALAPLGRLVVFGNATSADDVPISSHRLWLESLSVGGYVIGPLSQSAPELVREEARRGLELVADGSVSYEIADVLPLSDAAEGHRRLEAGETTGKLLLAADQ